MSADEPFEPIDHEEEMGFYFCPVRKISMWQETLDYDPDDPRNIAIEAKIATDDRAFLEACGIRPE